MKTNVKIVSLYLNIFTYFPNSTQEMSWDLFCGVFFSSVCFIEHFSCDKEN